MALCFFECGGVVFRLCAPAGRLLGADWNGECIVAAPSFITIGLKDIVIGLKLIIMGDITMPGNITGAGGAGVLATFFAAVVGFRAGEVGLET